MRKKNQSLLPELFDAALSVAVDMVLCVTLVSAVFVLEKWPVEAKFQE